MKTIMLLFLAPLQVLASQCANTPQALQGGAGVSLCYVGFAVSYDTVQKLPVWVAYEVTPEKVNKCSPAKRIFSRDPRLAKEQQPSTTQYNLAGYDNGHMADYADMRWSSESATASMKMPNVAPQRPKLNRGSWLALENNIRRWAATGKTVQVYTGAYDVSYDADVKFNVPASFFKTVVIGREAISYKFTQAGEPTVTSIAELEKKTGLKFPVGLHELTKPWPNGPKLSAACAY